MHKFSIQDNIVTVYITQRTGKQHEILLDLEDWNWVKDYGLCVQAYSRSFRAVIYDANSIQHYLHRVILNAPKGMKVDHVDGNGLDNRKEKLVICTQAENLQNRYHLVEKSISGERGVTWHEYAGKWQAKVTLDGKQNYLGLYDEVEDAAKVVKAFRALHMPFSKEGREEIK